MKGIARPTCFALLSLMTLFVAARATAGDADALVERVVAASGGRDKLAAVERLHAVGTTSSLRTGTTGASERWFANPDRLRIDIAYSPSYRESRILDGPRSWKDGAPATEPFRASMALQAARFRLPMILTERPVRRAGETNDGGRALDLLAVELGDDMRLEVAVDPATGLIQLSRGMVSFNGQTMEFATRYSDFRKAGDILLPHREEHYAMGMNTGETVLSQIEVNPPLPESVFRPAAP